MPNTCYMHADGDCEVGPAKPGNSRVGFNRPKPGPISIDKAVGFGAPNDGQDVVNIQHALDTIDPAKGGPMPRLVIDGKCGPKTNKAIRDFQLKHFPIHQVDGRIDPGKRTIQRINDLKDDSILPEMPLSFNNPTDKALFDGMMRQIPHTKACVEAAMSKLMLAVPTVDIPSNSPIGPSREEKMSLINRHFKIDRAPSAPRQPDLQKIINMYAEMLRVLNKPDNFFTLDTDNSGVTISTVAFARLGGFRSPDLSGRIVFRSGVAPAIAIPDFAAFIFIHELRHFVELAQRGGHFGKGWITDDPMQKLGPRDAMDNCDTYAGFALEAKNGIMQRPFYVKSSVFR